MQEVVARRRELASDRAPGRGVRPPVDFGWDMPHGGGPVELEESDAAAIAATTTACGESKVATGWLPILG
jgi:hypothetical protein